ncbi:MAG TPA: GNAT family N-acetyltransferase [Actinomycetota bacterium]|nr:GNAT family N-acetyltransferase [Actinomycetota bacterium]
MSAVVRPTDERDRAWVEGFIKERWGGPAVVAHGLVSHPQEHDGFVAEDGDERVGLLTYRIDDEGDLEVMTIDSVFEHQGIGTALIDAATEEARRRGSSRMWLMTTNDNLDALRFYQRRGFQLVAVHPEAVERARDMKPEIPAIGRYGIPVRDELELELEL